MYATRSTTRTIFPSSVCGSFVPVWVRIPSRTSSVRFRPSEIRSDCSLWRKRRPKRSWSRLVERVLARVPEGRVAGVVPEPDRLDEILVQPQRAGDAAGDRRRLERVRHPGAVVVARRFDEDLRLALEPAERLRVEDPVAVALERRSHPTFVLGTEAASGLVGAHRARRQPALLVLADARLEGVLDSSGNLGHRPPSLVAGPEGGSCA